MIKPIILSLAVLFSILFLVTITIEKRESAECIKWVEQAHTFDGYYLLDWQYEQCEAVGKPLPSGFLRAE